MEVPDDFRDSLEHEWAKADREAEARRDSMFAFSKLKETYKHLEPHEQALMEDVVCGWILSGDPRKQYDAINLAREFRLKKALSPLRKLMDEAELRTDHEAMYDWSMLNRVVAHIASDMQ